MEKPTNNIFWQRFILDVLIIICLVNGWWFFALPLGLFGVWFFQYFIELILAGIIYDSLFGYVSGIFWNGYLATIVAIGSFVLIFALRKVVRER